MTNSALVTPLDSTTSSASATTAWVTGHCTATTVGSVSVNDLSIPTS